MMAWLLAQTKASSELIARDNILNMGVDAYVPRFRDRNRVRCLFISYVFAFIPLVAGLPTIGLAGVRGVRCLVRFGDCPARVPVGLIEGYRSRHKFCKKANDYLLNLDEEANSVRVGDTLRVKTGPLADLKGLCTGFDDQGRVRVLLAGLFGGQTKVALSAKDVELA
jgi:hypothetical protein